MPLLISMRSTALVAAALAAGSPAALAAPGISKTFLGKNEVAVLVANALGNTSATGNSSKSSSGSGASPSSHTPWTVVDGGKCGNEWCKSTAEVTCTCVALCDCQSYGASGSIDCSGRGHEGCAHYVERRFYVNTDGSGNADCDTNWVYEENGDQVAYNWIYYWAPGHFPSDEVKIALYGSKTKGGDTHLGDYCTGWPIDGAHYSTKNNDDKGSYLGGSYYVHSMRADNDFQKFPDGSDFDNGMFGLRVVLWPHRDMQPYNQISCLEGDQASKEATEVSVAKDFKSKCVSGNCSKLMDKCASAIYRTYCLNLNDKWGGGVWDDFALKPFSFDGSVSIKSSYPMMSAFADRYADTFQDEQGPGAGRYCNPGKPWVDPYPGTCVLTRFYSVPCHKAKWNTRSKAKDDGASEYVLGCGTTQDRKLACGDRAGQGWSSYMNAMPTVWVQCVYTRVVDEQDGDCAARLRR